MNKEQRESFKKGLGLDAQSLLALLDYVDSLEEQKAELLKEFKSAVDVLEHRTPWKQVHYRAVIKRIEAKKG